LITGMEIRNQQFAKSIRGFNEEEVKSYLQMLAQNYEDLFSENAQLKESLQRNKFELEKYHKIEETMNNSLILAQQTAENLKINAQQEAERMLNDSKRSIAEMLTAYQEILKQLNMFNLDLKTQLSTKLALVEQNMQKNEDIANYFQQRNIKDIIANLNQLSLEDQG